MKKIAAFSLLLTALLQSWSISPDFINKYVENSKMLYADNGYEVVKEKTFEASDFSQGKNKIAYALAPGEYFVQLITEPCFKLNMEVNTASQEKEQGIISEKPEMRASIAIFDVPPPSGKPVNYTEIKLNGTVLDLCSNAKARILIYKRISY